MAINLKRNWRPALAAIAAAGSLGLLHCNVAKQDPSVDHRAVADTPTMDEAPVPRPETEPRALGGGPKAEEARVARGISALEQYLDGKGSGVNRFALEGLTYEHACPYLAQEGVTTVDTLADLLLKHPEAKISIESFTDSSGPDDVNKQLSLRRAEVVKKQLVQCGIQSSRIETIGRGVEDPIANNDSDDGKAQNRRTEVIVHK